MAIKNTTKYSIRDDESPSELFLGSISPEGIFTEIFPCDRQVHNVWHLDRRREDDSNDDRSGTGSAVVVGITTYNKHNGIAGRGR